VDHHNALKMGIGLGCALLGSFATSAAMVCQKLAHNRNAELAPEMRHREYQGMLMSPMWLGGMAINVAVIPFSAVSIALVPQSVLAPLSGVTIVCCQILAPWILKERITVQDWIASILIVAGCGLSTAFGDLCSGEIKFRQLLTFCESAFFWISEGVGAAFFIGVCIAICYLHRVLRDTPRQMSQGIAPPIVEESAHQYLALCFGTLGGFYGGQQNIAFKLVGEIGEETIAGSAARYWESWPPYISMFLSIAFAVGQISYLNKGLKEWTAVKVLPVYYSSLIFFSTSYGLIFYKEYEEQSLVHNLIFGCAVMIIVFGVLLLMCGTRVSEDALDYEQEMLYAKQIMQLIDLKLEEGQMGEDGKDADGRRFSVASHISSLSVNPMTPETYRSSRGTTPISSRGPTPLSSRGPTPQTTPRELFSTLPVNTDGLIRSSIADYSTFQSGPVSPAVSPKVL